MKILNILSPILRFMPQISAYLTVLVVIGQDSLDLFTEHSKLQTTSFIAASIIIILAATYEIMEYLKNRPTVCKSEDEINDYLAEKIRDGGRVCIVSRNLSWGTDHDAQSALADKARKKDLTLFVEIDDDQVKAVESEGAQVNVYGDKSEAPSCRFTITRYGTLDAELHIAHLSNDQHKIYKYSAKDGPIFHLAQDLVLFAGKLCAQ